MSTHVEWADAAAATVTFEHVRDPHGNVSDGPALLIHTGSSMVAIEGNRADLLTLLAKAHQLVREHGDQPMRDRYTVENGSERDVNEDTDYPCDECSTEFVEIWHERA